MWREDMLLYKKGKFYACGFAFELPDGYMMNTEPMECFPNGFGAWASGEEEIYVEWQIEMCCNGTYEELRELFIEGSGMFPITDINPIIVNGLPGHHVAYSYKGGQRYEIRLSSGDRQELSLRVEAQDIDILTAITTPAVQAAINGIRPWEHEDSETPCK